MRADKLIAWLSQIDGATEVIIAGEAHTEWAIEVACVIDGQAMLIPGARIPDGWQRPTHAIPERSGETKR